MEGATASKQFVTILSKKGPYTSKADRLFVESRVWPQNLRQVWIRPHLQFLQPTCNVLKLAAQQSERRVCPSM